MSEPFIPAQLDAMVRYEPYVLTQKPTGVIGFPYSAPAPNFGGAMQSVAFALTRSPRFFWDRPLLSTLDLIHAHFGPEGTKAQRLANLARLPLVVTFHGSEVTSNRSALVRSCNWYNWQFLARERSLQRSGAWFIAVSDYVRRSLVSRGYPAHQIQVHYIGVDTEKFRPAKKPRCRYVLCVARHVEVKGIDLLLSAFAAVCERHSDVRLVLVGSGPLTSSLERFADELGIRKRVDFLGNKTSAEVVTLMQNAAVFALFGRRAQSGNAEAFGMVFNEASACETPIVSVRLGGIVEAVKDGETGCLVEPGDIGAFSRCLDALLNPKSDLALRMGVAGRKYVCQHFDVVTQTRRLEAFYDDVIKWHGGKASV